MNGQNAHYMRRKPKFGAVYMCLFKKPMLIVVIETVCEKSCQRYHLNQQTSNTVR